MRVEHLLHGDPKLRSHIEKQKQLRAMLEDKHLTPGKRFTLEEQFVYEAKMIGARITKLLLEDMKKEVSS